MASDRLNDIVEAAVVLFSTKGYQGTSIRDLAVTVGVQPASLYAHIRGKEDLLLTIIERAAADFTRHGDEVLADTDEPVVARLRAFLRSHIRLITENLPAATVYLHEWRALDPKRQAAVLDQRDRYERRLVELLEEGEARGELRPLDAHLAATALFSMANGVYTWYSPDGPLGAEEIADRFLDLVVVGIAADGSASRDAVVLEEI